MENYFYRLVCVDEHNPLEYSVLKDETIGELEAVYEYIGQHIGDYTPELTKWMLFPVRRVVVFVRK